MMDKLNGLSWKESWTVSDDGQVEQFFGERQAERIFMKGNLNGFREGQA